MACVDENTFAAYFDLKLSPEETAQLFAHLDQCSDCAGLLLATASAQNQGSLARAMAATDGVAPTLPHAGPSSPPAATPSIGRYRVDRILGVGGMGVVYAGHDPELDRKVAIKLLRPDLGNSPETVRARLTREAQAIARLSHPNVINVFEIGTSGGQVFIVMELIDGTTLAEWLRAEPRSWRDIVRVFIAAGAGLEAAHRAGIVHRDFKPDNVLISGSDRVCVTDFGLARLSRSAEAAGGDALHHEPVDMSVTYSGRLIGTPAYMAPEQMRGEPTDARSDVFSFCAALYEALYATRPYRGQTVDELYAAASAGRLEPPRRNIGPRAHRLAIERGLDARPAARPASIGDLLRVLRVDPARRRRTIMAASLAVLTGAAAAGGYLELRQRAQRCGGMEQRLAAVWNPARKAAVHAAFVRSGVTYAEPVWRTVERQLDDYAGHWVAMRTSACEATRVQHVQSEPLLDRRMSCLDDRLDELRAQVELFSAADAALTAKAVSAVYSLSSLSACEAQTLLDEMPPPTEAQARALPALRRDLSRAMVLDASGRYPEVERLVPDLVAQAQRLGYGDGEAGAQYLMALVERRRAHPELAVAHLHRAAALAERAHDSRLVARCWRAVVSALQIMGKLDDGLLWSDYAEAVTLRANDGPVHVARVVANRSFLLANAGRRDEARAEGERALALLKSAPDGDTPQAYAARGNIASTFHQLGRIPEALALHRQVLDAFDRLYGHENPDTIIARGNVVSDLNDLGRYEEALPLANEVVAMQERAVGLKHRSLGLALHILAESENGVHRFADALEHVRRAVAIYEANAIGGASYVLALGLEGEVERELGRREARQTLERALVAGDKAGSGSLFVAPARFSLAQLETNHTRARLLATQARDALATATKDSPPTALTRARDDMDAWLSRMPAPAKP